MHVERGAAIAMSFPQPPHRDNFEVAIVCALKAEFDAICLVVEEFWDNDYDPYGKAMGDTNSYRTGRIGKHNVVLLQLRQKGKACAAAAAASLRSSFNKLRLVLLVGGCAAVPQSENTNIILGDVIISTGIVQYDFGRKYPNQFKRKNTHQDNLVKPCKEVGSILTMLQTSDMANRLIERTARLLIDLQKHSHKGYGSRYDYPGVNEDKLFNSSYYHKHHSSECLTCNMPDDSICDAALIATCKALGCDMAGLVAGRQRLEEKLQLYQNSDIAHQNPNIFFGLVGSGDTVMRSGLDRDNLAKEENIIAFEMEAAGLWEEVPTLVVKGVFDYGDSHKNEKWHNFSSATAACAARAVIERIAHTDGCPLPSPKEVPSIHRLEENHAVFHQQRHQLNDATTDMSTTTSISEHGSVGGMRSTVANVTSNKTHAKENKKGIRTRLTLFRRAICGCIRD